MNYSEDNIAQCAKTGFILAVAVVVVGALLYHFGGFIIDLF